mmetsp:Transcript_23449/g.23097  ORF Transcript_23449/g.23097 Transcript_23449/m.23097 type:complete len:82 (-) Transcript_23449:15-260(-)
MHIAAMKPAFTNKKEVPEDIKDKMREIGGEKELWKFFKNQVLVEQELATVEESILVKEYLREREAEALTALSIKDWALFKI